MALRTSPGVKSLAILLTLSVVVFVSGCTTGGDGVSYGNGLVITAFETDFTTVESGEDVTLRLRVQNQGEVDARNVKATIFGIDLDEWGSGISWSNDEKIIGTLLAADAQSNTEGQMNTEQWILEAPDYPEGIQTTETASVRVSYDYKTLAFKPITLVNEDELRSIMDAGRTIPGGATQSSAGPLSVQIKTGDFVKTKDTFNLDDPFPLNIIIINEGGGGLSDDSDFTGWGFDDVRYPVNVKIILPDGMALVSSEWCSTSGITVPLFKGRENTITCQIRIDDAPEISELKNIQVELGYKYYVDASTSINVIGNEQGWGAWD